MLAVCINPRAELKSPHSHKELSMGTCAYNTVLLGNWQEQVGLQGLLAASLVPVAVKDPLLREYGEE